MHWERGCGRAEAFLSWQRAVAIAAWNAHEQGDHQSARQLLDILEAGHDSPTRRAVMEDIDNLFVTEGIRPARAGEMTARGAVASDFTALLSLVAA
ncbi:MULTISPECIES: hypothetical protein [Microbacterium]|uniref:Uncharacterized protein n=1 Tax=Microbacterium wangchenii TaxID=2541726 RepID=A0ABX5SWE7_9MICO|nr:MULTISPECIES: hypothetical protein [Microbacterium]MCK6068513.1 hypothetical protein [Microbacterium sp. EYE_512]QBR89139.1 hypothetical protein E4K62_10850 [Microbacterium wangchenii]TXK09229.1 hypothetical protein FVP99_18345 [Microbacterium wangchenii]